MNKATADLIHIPFTSDLTLAGIQYACRLLAGGMIAADNAHLEAVRDCIAQAAVELAFRRWLNQENVPYQTSRTSPFSQPGLEEILISGHGCHIVNFSITQSSLAKEIKRDPACLLETPAWVAEAQLESERLAHADWLVFTFTTFHPGIRWRALDAQPGDHPPIYLMHLLPEAWRKNNAAVELTNEGKEPFTMELVGLGEKLEYQTAELALPPSQPVSPPRQFASLAFLAAAQVPSGSISIQRGASPRRLRVALDQWSNIWQYGDEIILAGCLRVGEFQRIARRSHSAVNMPAHAWYVRVRELLSLRQMIG